MDMVLPSRVIMDSPSNEALGTLSKRGYSYATETKKTLFGKRHQQSVRSEDRQP